MYPENYDSLSATADDGAPSPPMKNGKTRRNFALFAVFCWEFYRTAFQTFRHRTISASNSPSGI